MSIDAVDNNLALSFFILMRQTANENGHIFRDAINIRGDKYAANNKFHTANTTVLGLVFF
jgi:hypothetical protein